MQYAVTFLPDGKTLIRGVYETRGTLTEDDKAQGSFEILTFGPRQFFPLCGDRKDVGPQVTGPILKLLPQLQAGQD